ncbi:MAG: BamA/TamA family outer membrane protein [Alphaproteobacteria bacterium]|nr:BamA/TamA family outer membrane protein [Alphaproteobacteria bacterium]
MKKITFTLICICSLRATEIKGINDNEIASVIMTQIDDLNTSVNDVDIVKIMATQNIKTIKKVLNSFGYYDAAIDYRITNKVIFDVKLKDRYKFNRATIVYTDRKNYDSGLTTSQFLDLIGIKEDSYIDTKHVSDACAKIEDYFKGKGFAFVSVVSQKIIPDYDAKKLDIKFYVSLNGETTISKTHIHTNGCPNSEALTSFVRNRLTWSDGAKYKKYKIDDVSGELLASGIFSGIEAKLSDPVFVNESQVKSDLIMNLECALPREIAAGVKYGSSEKLGVLFSWTHYNIDNKGSKLTTLVDFAKDSKNAKIKFDTYDLFLKRQDLATQVSFFKESADSYNVRKVGLDTISWQDVSKHFRFGGGMLYERSKTKDKINNPTNSYQKFNAFGVPIGLNIDTTKNYVDPQKGFRCNALLTTYFGNLTNISILEGKASLYVPIRQNKFKNTAVLAAYVKFGSILRANKNNVPRDKFFFAGGANSVRGYGYQKLGRITDDKKPYGGESLFEFGIEPRIKITDTIGLVSFFEGGNVYDSKAPNPMKKMLFGYGVGVRYYTMFGPVRFDIAFPTKRRHTKTNKKIDSMFNIYISVGQAF